MSGYFGQRIPSAPGLASEGIGLRHFGHVDRGFTLIELMIGVVLLAVLLSIAVPMYSDFILNQRLRAITTDLRIGLMTARSEAIKRNRDVTLAPDGAGWGAGWTIASPNAGEPALLNHAQTGSNVSIAGPASSAQFTASGRVLALETFDITVGPAGQSVQSCLTLGLDGRTSSTTGACP